MQNKFMEKFKKRLIKALGVGGLMVLFMITTPLWSSVNPFESLPTILIPIVLLLTILYGTGWYFAFNLIKRSFRKFLRASSDATIWQAITGKGLVLGIVYGMICLVVGCILAVFVGNYFMVRDYLLAKEGQPPISVKYKFDSDLEYDECICEFNTLCNAVHYNEAANNVDAQTRAKNAEILQSLADKLGG